MCSFLAQRRFPAIIPALLICYFVLQLAACGSTSSQTGSQASPTASQYKPVTLQNCGHALTFNKPPERIISTYQTTTDILLKLGLGSRIVGIYYKALYEPQAEFSRQYQGLTDLGGDTGMGGGFSKEKVLSVRPDFVFAAYPAGDFLASYGEVTQEQFNAQGAQIYGMSGECSNDSTKVRAGSIYDDILNIGRIFGVEPKAQQLVETMKARIAAVQKRVASLPPTNVIAMPNFSSTKAAAPIIVVGAGIYSDILRLAGGNNLFGTQNKTYPTVSQEAFAAQKANVYVLIHYIGADTNKISSYLFSTYPNTPASQQKRVAIVESSQWNAGIFLPDAIEKLARVFHPEAF